ncbi:OsmC family protein [Candidatus Bipolaricaulota bacterium]|nr:OsmC family protein [Candidatus Bipolaricaulota bacterium]
MKVREAEAVWNGNLVGGSGDIKLGSGAFEGKYSFASRFEEGSGTNPEELIGAAHAGCFSMALSNILEEEGYSPERIETDARVSLDEVEGDFKITGIELITEGSVPDITEGDFREKAELAKDNCPVSVALSNTDISLKASLK